MKMKNIYLILLLFAFACKKTTTNSSNTPTPVGTVLSLGNFTTNAHTTTGTVKTIESNGKKYLAFENFSTEAGPDLEVWISKNTSVADYKSLGKLKANSGTFNYELTADQNTTTYNYVLIWCKSFSVLFGHSLLR